MDNLQTINRGESDLDAVPILLANQFVSRFSSLISFSCELFSAVARLIGNGDVGHRRRASVSGRNNFTGLADYDVFTADIRLQTERYEMVGLIGKPLRNTTRAPPDSATSCQ